MLFSLGFLLISIGVLASLVSMVLRWRRTQGEQRQQVRLIAASAALISIGLVALFVVQLFNGGRQTWAASLPLYISYLLLPILFAVAVLRYRLYDIEVIINRTVVLVVGSAFAGIGYTTLVVAVGKLVEGRTSGFWLSLLATALVALAFQPLGGRSPGWPTGSHSGREPSPMKPSRTSAAASPRRRPRTRSCLPSRRPRAGRSPLGGRPPPWGSRVRRPTARPGATPRRRAPSRTSYRSGTAAPSWAASRCTCPGAVPCPTRTNGC